MSEFAEDMAALSEYKRQKRADNTASSTDMLTKAGIEFTSLNGGVQLRLLVGRKLIDFWPSTGLWMMKGNPRKYRGVRSLIAFVNREIAKATGETP